MSGLHVIGLGVMRSSTDADRDAERAAATLGAALAGGVTIFDTARAYGLDHRDAGHSERLVGALVPRDRVVVTKCGMRREGAAWIPDGRASAILADAEASAAALGRAPDVLLLHAPDPAVDLATSARALARARERGLARAVGLSNATRKNLEIAAAHAPIEAVENALGPFEDSAVRGGVVAWCRERGARFFAHSPFGGPARAERLGRDKSLLAIARRLGATAHEVLLAYLATLGVVPLPGARRPETAASVARARALALDEDALASLDARFPRLAPLRGAAPRPAKTSREVVLVMGVPGAGKSRIAAEYAARGYTRLNRDELGGTLRGVDRRLDEALAAGGERFVLDNTYVTRASRSDVVRIADRHGAHARCVFVDTPCADAEINVVTRMLDVAGALLGGDELARAAKAIAANLIAPTTLARMLRDLELPEASEGFSSIERRAFVREAPAGGVAAAAVSHRLVGDDAVTRALAEDASRGPVLVFGWAPAPPRDLDARVAALAELTGREVHVSLCRHAGGPPRCWCRPPLPGAWVAFARAVGADASASVLFASSAADRALARKVGLRERPSAISSATRRP